MKKRAIIFAVAVLLIIALLFAFADKKTGTEQQNKTAQNKDVCFSDADCVKDSCCHASGCIAIGKAPKCEGVLCSQECAPETLDCGQGSCRCANNRCEVSFNE